MSDSDRLPEIQARAAKARAGSVDVDWLIAEVVKARAENQTLGTEKGLLEERFAQLVTELDKLREESAEEKAMNNPRLRCLIVKAAPDRDLYIGWSNTCEMPAGAWTRAEAIAYGFPPSRLDRADKTGTSSQIGDGAWDAWGFIAEQRGTLRRDRLGDYAQLWLDGKQDAAFDLLEPFDGETEVRR